MSTDDLLVRHDKSDDSASTSPATPTSTATPAPSSSLNRLRDTFRRTESISSHIFSQISTQFSNAAAAAAASEVIDGTTTYPETPQTVATVSNTPVGSSAQPKRKKPGECILYIGKFYKRDNCPDGQLVYHKSQKYQ